MRVVDYRAVSVEEDGRRKAVHRSAIESVLASKVSCLGWTLRRSTTSRPSTILAITGVSAALNFCSSSDALPSNESANEGIVFVGNAPAPTLASLSTTDAAIELPASVVAGETTGGLSEREPADQNGTLAAWTLDRPYGLRGGWLLPPSSAAAAQPGARSRRSAAKPYTSGTVTVSSR